MISRRNLFFLGAAGAVASVGIPKACLAQSTRTNRPLLSAHWRSQSVQGDPPGGIMPFASDGRWQISLTVPMPASNGTDFASKALIVGVSLTHVIDGGGCGEETAMIGHWSNGRASCDYISEEVTGGNSRTVWFPPGMQPEYWKGDFFDCHVSGAQAGHYVDVVFFHIPLYADA